MHFEILIEDQSGKQMLDIIIPEIIGNTHTFKVHPYKGIGRIPKKLKVKDISNNRILLNQLPKICRGYGKTFASQNNYNSALIVICDLDDKCLKTFRQQLYDILNASNPKPKTRFCIAIEEGEAWLLGDIAAVKTAYPNAKDKILNTYKNDSICGTWELLADATSNEGAQTLKQKGWQAIGKRKSEWAKKISPNIDINSNKSPSFNYFKEKLSELINETEAAPTE